MGVKKIEIRPKGDGSYSDILYPKTSADQVVTNDGTTVEEEISNLKSSVSNGKLAIATAITDKGIITSGSDTFATMASNIRDIVKSSDASKIAKGQTLGGVEGTYTSDANAVADDILRTKTAYVNGNKITGNMPNHGSYSITPGTYDKTIPAGYHNGSGVVYGSPNLIPSNIKQGVNIFGVDGNVVPGGTGMIKSIQRGTVVLGSNGTVDISEVDPTKSIILISTCCREGDGNGAVTAHFSSSSQISFTMNNDNNYVNISWEVVEFESGVSVQSGILFVGNNVRSRGELGTPVTATISPVDLSKSFLIVTNYDGNTDITSRVMGRLINSTTVEVYFGGAGGNARWQVLTFV